VDDKAKQDGRDDSKVDLNDPSEVQHAAKQAGTIVTRYEELAEKSGNTSRTAIAKYIKDHA